MRKETWVFRLAGCDLRVARRVSGELALVPARMLRVKVEQRQVCRAVVRNRARGF